MQYVKIKDAIVEQIETGMLLPRQKLPSERKLADSFATTRVTLREALSLMEAEGSIYREDRRGWFISPPALHYDPSQPLSFMDMAKAQNRSPKTELVQAKVILADKQASQLLDLPPFSDVYQVERVRYLEDRPVVYATHYIRPELFPNLLHYDLSSSLTDIYQQQFGVKYQKVHYSITAGALFGDLAEALRATAGTSATVIERVNYDQKGNQIDCTVEYWRHDALRIKSVVHLTC